MKEYLLENPQVVVTLIIGIVGLIITWWYNKNNLKIAHQKLEKELFNEFNTRYDNLNDYLKKMTEIETYNDEMQTSDYILKEFEIDGKSKSVKAILIDYFNLCAEEYYWQKHKSISPAIWGAWHAGMMYYYKNYKVVRELWESECKEGWRSYYLENEEDFFQLE